MKTRAVLAENAFYREADVQFDRIVVESNDGVVEVKFYRRWKLVETIECSGENKFHARSRLEIEGIEGRVKT